MRTVSASIVVSGAAPVEAEQLWHDPSRWASWVDGLAHVSKLDGEWPLEGARRIWTSPPGGRGIVAETVVAYAAGRSHSVQFEDQRVAGLQRVRFEGGGGATKVTVELELAPKRPMPPVRWWWLRRGLRDGLRRTLTRFSYELAADR